ncbi:hypothetical protein R3P38DRAFT_3367862 [Favolaschia claudopus]|uniref:Uncharacterized protein n=1 Tax=Favolaschia claudopus TaxID=2862362 RepID=A0AAW0A717_9AGAR
MARFCDRHEGWEQRTVEPPSVGYCLCLTFVVASDPVSAIALAGPQTSATSSTTLTAPGILNVVILDAELGFVKLTAFESDVVSLSLNICIIKLACRDTSCMPLGRLGKSVVRYHPGRLCSKPRLHGSLRKAWRPVDGGFIRMPKIHNGGGAESGGHGGIRICLRKGYLNSARSITHRTSKSLRGGDRMSERRGGTELASVDGQGFLVCTTLAHRHRHVQGRARLDYADEDDNELHRRPHRPSSSLPTSHRLRIIHQ